MADADKQILPYNTDKFNEIVTKTKEPMMMFLHFFFFPMLATLVFIAVLYSYAIKIDFTDKPSHRKQHKKPVPLIGGLAIYLALLVTLLINKSLPNQTAFISAVTLLVCVGLIDDYRHLSIKIRMIAQIAAGLILSEYADIKINNLGDLCNCSPTL